MKKTKKAYERHLNELYADTYSKSQAVDNFIYLANKMRSGGHTSERGIINAHANHMLGSLVRKYDPIAFNTGYNDWNP